MENQHIVSKYYCGADLHSKTTYICIMDRDGNILLNRNLPNNFLVFKSLINPFLPDLVVSDITALIILYETHDLDRFSSVQKFSFYCRVVRCQPESNGKLKSGKNQKIGSPYLRWAFGQILHHAKICNEPIHKLYQKLKHKHGPARARSIMAHKFAVK